jgi:hypothetical protein
MTRNDNHRRRRSMTSEHPGYRTGRSTPLEGGELVQLAELLERYPHHRPRTPTPAVAKLRAEIAIAAGLVR